MWFDDSDASLVDKLIALRQRTHERLGYPPDVCHVGPDMIQEDGAIICGVRLIKDTNLPHNHFWMGREEDA